MVTVANDENCHTHRYRIQCVDSWHTLTAVHILQYIERVIRDHVANKERKYVQSGQLNKKMRSGYGWLMAPAGGGMLTSSTRPRPSFFHLGERSGKKLKKSPLEDMFFLAALHVSVSGRFQIPVARRNGNGAHTRSGRTARRCVQASRPHHSNQPSAISTV